MANSNKSSREAKARVARMEANQTMHQDQVQRRKRDNRLSLIAILAAVAIATVLALTVFSPQDDNAAAPEPSATDTATPAPEGTNSPTVPNADTAKGKTFSGTLTLNGKPLGVQLDGTKAPQAAAVFKSLADEGFMTGKTCHRLTNSPNFGVLQCGSLKGNGDGDPTYQWGPVENTPADGVYPAGTIAVARGNSTYANGTQFFITYEDTNLPQGDGGYSIVGKVTSGLDVVSAIAKGGIEGGTTDGAPKTKVTIDSLQLK
ncbi:cyclophilin type peptidyl-prolyl cis-trans isomerase [Arthrobacter sp. PAMC 25486]|uniref:peptidylprolyl isomerase n=1 Tax=Arthrobacter sp. PAMC 25486 TaxID=1494608 RepID=UPI000535AA8E|nr:peptidylprolyl isomerase [Arthrobacter sp. PAMC 25486]AIY00577.1 cyclophilin type peptidyl-prolyl cis-trans isomerase [Arthrobacter sp. PAMC 25486]